MALLLHKDCLANINMDTSSVTEKKHTKDKNKRKHEKKDTDTDTDFFLPTPRDNDRSCDRLCNIFDCVIQ